MSDHINAHHALEEELLCLHLLRDLGHPAFLPELEDSILDRMEALWARMSDRDRIFVEAQRSARFDAESPPAPNDLGSDFVEVERHLERSLPRRVPPAAG